jgi:hypothetical protein
VVDGCTPNSCLFQSIAWALHKEKVSADVSFCVDHVHSLTAQVGRYASYSETAKYLYEHGAQEYGAIMSGGMVPPQQPSTAQLQAEMFKTQHMFHLPGKQSEVAIGVRELNEATNKKIAYLERENPDRAQSFKTKATNTLVDKRTYDKLCDPTKLVPHKDGNYSDRFMTKEPVDCFERSYTNGRVEWVHRKAHIVVTIDKGVPVHLVGTVETNPPGRETAIGKNKTVFVKKK